MKTSKAVGLYNALKSLRISKLPKEEQFKIIRTAKALKETATDFEDFLTDARERLKPDGFDAVVEKSQRFAGLTDDEKRAVNKAVADYQKDVDDCVKEELEKEVEIEGIAPMSEETLNVLTEQNDLNVETILLLGEM